MNPPEISKTGYIAIAAEYYFLGTYKEDKVKTSVQNLRALGALQQFLYVKMRQNFNFRYIWGKHNSK